MRNNGIRCAEYFMYRSIGIGFCFSFAFFFSRDCRQCYVPTPIFAIVSLWSLFGCCCFYCCFVAWKHFFCVCFAAVSVRVYMPLPSSLIASHRTNKQTTKKKRIHGVYIMCRGCDYSVVWLLPFDERKHNPQPNVDVDFRLIPFLLFFFSSLHHFLRTLSFHSSFFFFSTFSTVFLSSMLPFHPFVFLLLLLLSLCFHPYQTMHKQCGMRSIRFK